MQKSNIAQRVCGSTEDISVSTACIIKQNAENTTKCAADMPKMAFLLPLLIEKLYPTLKSIDALTGCAINAAVSVIIAPVPLALSHAAAPEIFSAKPIMLIMSNGERITFLKTSAAEGLTPASAARIAITGIAINDCARSKTPIR